MKGGFYNNAGKMWFKNVYFKNKICTNKTFPNRNGKFKILNAYTREPATSVG